MELSAGECFVIVCQSAWPKCFRDYWGAYRAEHVFFNFSYFFLYLLLNCLYSLAHPKVSYAFRLNNREAKRESLVRLKCKLLPFCATPKYLGLILDRLLTY